MGDNELLVDHVVNELISAFSKNTAFQAALLCLPLFLGNVLWLVLSPFPPALAYIGMVIEITILGGLFLLACGCAVFRSQERILHLILALVILAVCVGGFEFARLMGGAQRRWFFRTGQEKYAAMVDRIREGKLVLTSQNLPLGEGVNHQRVYGRTNADGSMIVYFPGGWRRGIMYYSGKQLVASADQTNLFFFPQAPDRYYSHLTNGWYEY